MSTDKDAVIYVYVQTSDSDFAPCYDNGIWTLACCKPQIRFSAARRISEGKDIFIIGITSKAKGIPRKPIYIARVSRVETVSEYFSCERNRCDSVYIKNSDKWQTKTRNQHLHKTCKEKCIPETTVTDVVDISAADSDCWRDLYYREKENYVLISAENDFVHYSESDRCSWTDNKILEGFEGVSRAYRVRNIDKQEMSEWNKWFEDEKKRINNRLTLHTDIVE